MSNDNDKLFYINLQKNLSILNNSNKILKKLYEDQNLKTLKNIFEIILKEEINYAVNKIKKLKKSSMEEIKYHLINNSYIFKENLKTINDFMVDYIWKEITKGDILENIITNDQYIFDIKEVTNDDISSDNQINLVQNQENIEIMEKIDLSLKLNNLNSNKNKKRIHLKCNLKKNLLNKTNISKVKKKMVKKTPKVPKRPNQDKGKISSYSFNFLLKSKKPK